MKIEYIKHKDIDKQRWDSCIEKAENGIIYATSWYLDITSPGWDALIYGDYNAVMPLTWRKKFGLKYLIQPYYSQQLGVFGTNLIPQLTQLFFKAIPLKFLVIRIKCNVYNNLGAFKNKDFKNLNFELDLNKPYEEIAKNYTTNNSRNLKQALKKNLQVQPIDANTFYNFYSAFIDNKLKTLPDRHFTVFKQILEEGIKRELITLYGLFNQSEQLCAGALFLKYLNRNILLALASNEKGREDRAMFFILDQFIRENSGNPEILDFEGSNVESIARFYSGFGAKSTYYYSLYFNNLKTIPLRLRSIFPFNKA